ncbi:AraC family transcriptional regulator [Lacrimispora sp. BS-2]|uniref:AraC family transcriptional regulator n=1 Tax=Lacrimispora sp. BS-2 TaxID=3151850 RepID=A0AAU7PPZ3_9FIRM
MGICCYANTSRTVYAYCEAGKPARFTKIMITQDYFDTFIHERYGDTYCNSLNTISYLTQNPNSPELNFIFQQIRDCTAMGTALQIYLDGKVLEVLSLVTHHFNQARQHTRLPVKLDQRDRRSLSKTITFMKKDLSAYPSVKELAKAASMSESRYQLAFKQVYGTTVYEYLKALRMNNALLLLRDSDFDIRTIAGMVGYSNAGHFSGLFKKLYGVSPKEYRLIHGIK